MIISMVEPYVSVYSKIRNTYTADDALHEMIWYDYLKFGLNPIMVWEPVGPEKIRMTPNFIEAVHPEYRKKFDRVVYRGTGDEWESTQSQSRTDSII